MSIDDANEPWASDPLAARLARIEDPSLSPELIARVAAGRPAPRRRRFRARYAVVPLALLAALSLLAASPAGAAVGRALLPPGMRQRFGLVTGAPTTLHPPGPNDCAIVAGAPGMRTSTFTTREGLTVTEETRLCQNGRTVRSWSYRMPIMDIGRAQVLVNFRIRTATWLPAGLELSGIGMSPNPPQFTTYADQVSVVYQNAGATLPSPNVTINERPGGRTGGSAVPRATSVSVNGGPASYVHGSYETVSGADRWNPTSDTEELSWRADGITYDMTATGLRLTQADMIRIADSIQ